MLVAQELKKHLATSTNDIKLTQQRIKTELKEIDKRNERLKNARKKLINDYAIGTVDRDTYIGKCLWYDNEENKSTFEQKEILKQIPTFHKEDIIEANLRIFCETARARYKRCTDFDAKRKFILNFVEYINYNHGIATLFGSVPIRLKEIENTNQSSEINKIAFSIRAKI